MLCSSSLYAAAVYDGKPIPDDATERCRIAAIEMIKIGEEAVKNSNRPERAAKRKAQVDSWKQSLEAGKDPCLVYQDIFKASNLF
ncbi:MAG: hypothetical protein ACPHLK_03335 [Gammaproteobacteria bacterium]